MSITHSENASGISDLVATRADALRSKSPTGTLSTQAPDFVQYGLGGPLQLAGDTAMDVAYLEQAFGGFEGPVDYEVVDQHELIGEDVAVTYSLARIGYTVAGKRTDMWFRKTLAMAKIDGAWAIVHEHESVPMTPEGTAATDLRP
ncbi:nuclear transport factor 2 family protein [Rhodococcoides yunnanense]|uniref:Nuclear transport factor 2 family protein n=1 Tax=Rhodococcoides yunnanense TaxID=278209 RepID=A0ABU4B6K3_9NOCA|nr:nuclear transport factor 2 family protein [Rhodococcus yunnanensis]MDV6259820.1 nuclear transport factor 2 family protein [Rhodococcus yunnanensis]